MRKKISLDDRILIAGAHGMAGSAIYRSLKSKGYGNINKKGIIFTPRRNEVDFAEINSVEKWFKANKPSVVIIAAAKVGGIVANFSQPTEFLLENLKIQTNLIEISWRSEVKRLLFLGSSCIYPKFSPQPIEEESLLTNSLEETNQWYAIAKITGLKLCEALRKQYNFDAISLMPTNLYGKGDNYHLKNSHVMASFIRRFYEASKNSLSSVTCWGTGSPFREFLHVDDLGDAVVFSLEHWDPDSNNSPRDKFDNPLYWLNVGTGNEISIKDLAYKISYYVNYKGEVLWDHSKPDGTPRKQLNINKIKELGWKPKINLDEGIKKTLKSYELDNQKI